MMTKFQKLFIGQFSSVLDELKQYAEDPRFAGLTDIERDVMFQLKVAHLFNNAYEKTIGDNAKKEMR